MALLCRLFFVTATYNFTVNVSHIPGTDNRLADSLSRLQFTKFHSLAPEADQTDTVFPAEAWHV